MQPTDRFHLSNFHVIKKFHKTFVEATAYEDMSIPLDFTGGRAQVIGGAVYYSPNCTRTMTPPLSTHDAFVRSPSSHSIEDVHRPFLWSSDTAYLAFVPLSPDYNSVPFDDLLDLPSHFDRKRLGFTDVPRAIRLALLEKDLDRAAEYLRRRYEIHQSKPIVSPSIVTCGGHFKQSNDFRREIKRTQGWFSLKLGLLAYEIAVALSMEEGSDSDNGHSWIRHLTSQGWSQAALSGIQSCAANFTPYCPRVGMFVDISEPPSGQCSIAWLMKFHVPVWYRWSDKESRRAKGNRRMAKLAPLPHHLQLATTFLTKTPSMGGPPPTLEPTTEAPTVNPNTEKPWIAFLAERKKVCEEMTTSESPADRIRRLNRERHPPIVKTKVFVWELDSDCLYVRTRVHPSDNESTLEDFGEKQKFYNAFLNEWDCGDDLGELTPEEKDEHYYERGYDLFEETEPSGSFSEEQLPSGPVKSSDNFTQSSESLSVGPWIPIFRAPERAYAYDVGSYPATQTLYESFGFTPPLPVPVVHPHPVKVSEGITKIFRSIVGMRSMDSAFEASTIFQYCQEFLEAYVKGLPRSELFDLSSGNRQPLAAAPRLKSLHIIKDNLYFFDINEGTTGPRWRVAVTNSMDALFVCRLPNELRPRDICRELFNRGIQFHTLLDLRPVPRSIIPPTLIPIRLADYQFTKSDYLAYIQERDALLRNPRIGRAALMRGGIVWRLTASQVSFWDIIRGPTPSVTLHRQGLTAQYHSIELWDDDLDSTETDRICGVVHCYTGISLYFIRFTNF